MSTPRKPKTAPRVVHEHAEFFAPPAVPKRHRSRWILGDSEADAVEAEVSEHVRKRRGEDAKPTAERKAKDVERFELLAKATAKVPTVAPRRIYVDKRDGSIGEITARDLGNKLLEREAIASETADGVRPKVVLCAVCKCAVVVQGKVPRTCKKHSEKKLCPRGCGRAITIHAQSCCGCMTPEERSAIARKRNAARTHKQRSEAARKANAALTREQRSYAARKANAARTPEERSETARKRHAALTPEQRSETMRKANAARTAEDRSNAARKGRSTQLARVAAEKAGEQ